MMNTKASANEMQEKSVKAEEKVSRSERRRQAKVAEKSAKKNKKADQPGGSAQSQREKEVIQKAEGILANLKAKTWRDLEVGCVFKKNQKLTFINDGMLIVGCDVGSENHYARAIDAKGIEVSKKAFAFSNSKRGFESLKEWAVKLAAEHGKNQVVLGLEPTGHYWYCLAVWLLSNGITVVQVNPYAVKQTKELEDNSQNKDDLKDPKVIANLVKNGNYGMPYLPEGVYADIRGLSVFRDQIMESRIQSINRLHRELKIYFPEYEGLYADGIAKAFSLALLKAAPLPEDVLKAGADGIREIWKKEGLRGRGYGKAEAIVDAARESIGRTEGGMAGRMAIQHFAREIEGYAKELGEIEALLWEKCKGIPYAENITAIEGLGERIVAGIVAEIGDISRFDEAKELQKLAGLGLVKCSSGKHKGETKISHRGRKRLRYWLFQGARSVVAHAEEFKWLHGQYTARALNPLKKMQSLMAIACKLLRVVYAMLKHGTKYDPEKLRKDMRMGAAAQPAA